MKKFGLIKKMCLGIFACIIFCAPENAYADGEFSFGFGAGYNNYNDMDLDIIIIPNWISVQMLINLGWTTADIEAVTRRATAIDASSLGVAEGSLMSTKRKSIKPFDFDLLFDLSAGFPYAQGGGIFNLYLLPIGDWIIIGAGVGSGYAIGYGPEEERYDDFKFSHGPYIRGHLPIRSTWSAGGVGVLFDYYFFEEGYMQISAYFKFLL